MHALHQSIAVQHDADNETPTLCHCLHYPRGRTSAARCTLLINEPANGFSPDEHPQGRSLEYAGAAAHASQAIPRRHRNVHRPLHVLLRCLPRIAWSDAVIGNLEHRYGTCCHPSAVSVSRMVCTGRLSSSVCFPLFSDLAPFLVHHHTSSQATPLLVTARNGLELV